MDVTHPEPVRIVAQEGGVGLQDAGQKVVLVDARRAVLDGEGQSG